MTEKQQLLQRAIEILANQLYHSYMSGDMLPRTDGQSTIAAVFEVDSDFLEQRVVNYCNEKYGTKLIPWIREKQ